ncbi:hypothetical protein ABZP36_021019 [Zizania latifolia]
MQVLRKLVGIETYERRRQDRESARRVSIGAKLRGENKGAPSLRSPDHAVAAGQARTAPAVTADGGGGIAGEPPAPPPAPLYHPAASRRERKLRRREAGAHRRSNGSILFLLPPRRSPYVRRTNARRDADSVLGVGLGLVWFGFGNLPSAIAALLFVALQRKSSRSRHRQAGDRLP